MATDHITDHDLELYYLGMLRSSTDVMRLQEHLATCRQCVRQAISTADYIETLQRALLIDSQFCRELRSILR